MAFVIERATIFYAKRKARRSSDSSTEVILDAGVDAVPAVLQALADGQPRDAIRSYLALDQGERQRVPIEAIAELAGQFVAQGEPDAALALYRQAADDRPRGPGLDRIFLGLGLVLLHGKGRPTAAYQYLMNAIEADPCPEVDRAARQALALISQLQKHQPQLRQR